MPSLVMKRVLGIMLLALAWFFISHLQRSPFAPSPGDGQLLVLKALSAP
jgi:hypothetical protein